MGTKTILFISSIAFLSLIPFMIPDNTDLDLKGQAAPFLLKQSPSLNPDLIEKGEQKLLTSSSAKPLIEKFKNHCLNGRVPESEEQKLQFFKEGPCSPVAIVPGIAGTALQIDIQCETLKEKHPEIFSNCGWETCSSWEFWQSRPASEYRLWIPDMMSPMTVMKFGTKNRCLGDLTSLYHNISEPEPKKRYSWPQGLRVTWYGDTNDTKKASHCGANAIRTLSLSRVFEMLSCDSYGFLDMIDLVEAMGYQTGITYQAIPYDFRFNLITGESQNSIPKSLKSLNKITGKKAIIVAHSLGNIQVLYALNSKMTQTEKDSLIKEYISVAPPFMGAAKGVRDHIGGDPDFMKQFFGYQIGIPYESQEGFFGSCGSLADAYPKDAFERFKNEEWMKDLKLRISQENELVYNPLLRSENKNGDQEEQENNDKGDEDDSLLLQQMQEKETTLRSILEKMEKSEDSEKRPLKWFPPLNLNCSTKFGNRPFGNCITGVRDFDEIPILEVEGKQYFAKNKDLKEVLSKFTQNPDHYLTYFKESEENDLQNLVNPNVETKIIYGTFQNTEMGFGYEHDPQPVVKENQDFYFPEKNIHALGDGTIISASTIVPAAKWIYEFEHAKNYKDAKKVEVVEYCSNIDQYGDYYRGIQCECMHPGGKTNKCQHSCMINDFFFLEYIAKAIIQSEPSSGNTLDLTTDEILSMQEECSNLHNNFF